MENALEQYVAAEFGKKRWHRINHLCTTCLKTYMSKRKITKDDLWDVKNYIEPGKKMRGHQ